VTDPGAGGDALTQALIRAIPVTRMIDSGMDVGSALRLTEAVSLGGELSEHAENEADRLLDAVDALGVELRRPVRRAALGALVVAQLAFNTDTPRKRALYDRIGVQLAALESESGGHYRNVTIPFDGAVLTGFLLVPDAIAEPSTVILFGGLNGWGVAYLPMAEALADVGLAVLIVELPGQGTARMAAGLSGGSSSVDAISSCIDWITDEPDLGNRAGVWGNSYGGLFAALAAAKDSRVAAVCVNGAPARPTVPPFRTMHELMGAFFGVDSVDGIASALPEITFADKDRTIDCPILVFHGGADPLVAVDDQRPFFDAGTGERTWHELPDGQHTLYNHTTERNAIAAAWFTRQLVGDAQRA
jgi:dipeptidyl aminopeptidase/acylaminoacyl peptidase